MPARSRLKEEESEFFQLIAIDIEPRRMEVPIRCWGVAAERCWWFEGWWWEEGPSPRSGMVWTADVMKMGCAPTSSTSMSMSISTSISTGWLVCCGWESGKVWVGGAKSHSVRSDLGPSVKSRGRALSILFSPSVIQPSSSSFDFGVSRDDGGAKSACEGSLRVVHFGCCSRSRSRYSLPSFNAAAKLVRPVLSSPVAFLSYHSRRYSSRVVCRVFRPWTGHVCVLLADGERLPPSTPGCRLAALTLEILLFNSKLQNNKQLTRDLKSKSVFPVPCF